MIWREVWPSAEPTPLTTRPVTVTVKCICYCGRRTIKHGHKVYVVFYTVFEVQILHSPLPQKRVLQEVKCPLVTKFKYYFPFLLRSKGLVSWLYLILPYVDVVASLSPQEGQRWVFPLDITPTFWALVIVGTTPLCPHLPGEVTGHPCTVPICSLRSPQPEGQTHSPWNTSTHHSLLRPVLVTRVPVCP